MLRTLVPYLVFPVLALGPTWLGIAGLDAGLDARVVVAGAVAIGLSLQLALEQALPYRHDWRARRRLAPDLAWLGSSTVVGGLLDVLALSLLAHVAAGLSAALGATLWPTGWNVWAQLVAAPPLR